jgi:hypothetical protein
MKYIIRFITDEGFYFDYQKRGKTEYTSRGAKRIANRLYRQFNWTCYLIEVNV